MRDFLRRILLFFGLLGTLLIVADMLLIHGLQKRQTHVLGVWNRLFEGEINAEILFTGSSRTYVHFDTPAITEAVGKNCYNIGMDGSQLNLQYPWLKKYLEHNEKPELIIQGLDIISLMPDTDTFFPTQFPAYLDDEDIFASLIDIDQTWYRHKYIPFYSFTMFGFEFAGVAIKGLLGLEDVQKDPLQMGYDRRDIEWDGTFDRYAQNNPNGKKIGISNKGIDQLRQIIELCQKEQVPLVLCYAPELAENFELTNDRSDIFQVYEDLADQYKVPFWDLSEMDICHDRKYFYNSQHLNLRGVDRLTDEIVQRIKVLEGSGYLID